MATLPFEHGPFLLSTTLIYGTLETPNVMESMSKHATMF